MLFPFYSESGLHSEFLNNSLVQWCPNLGHYTWGILGEFFKSQSPGCIPLLLNWNISEWEPSISILKDHQKIQRIPGFGKYWCVYAEANAENCANYRVHADWNTLGKTSPTLANSPVKSIYCLYKKRQKLWYSRHKSLEQRESATRSGSWWIVP